MKILRRMMATAAAALCLPALAQVDSSVTASNLRYVLGDLRPGDGQAPSISFPTTGRALVAMGSSWRTDGTTVYSDAQELFASGPLEAAVAWKDALRAGAVLEQGADVEIGGGRLQTRVDPGNWQIRYTDAAMLADYAFRLAPYSSLTVSLDVEITLKLAPNALYGQDGYGGGALSGYGAFSDGEQATQGGYDGLELTVYDNARGSVTSAHGARTLSFSFANATADWGEGGFSFSFESKAELAPLSPVPEPGRQALLLAGLAVLGLARIGAGRRKKGEPKLPWT